MLVALRLTIASMRYGEATIPEISVQNHFVFPATFSPKAHVRFYSNTSLGLRNSEENPLRLWSCFLLEKAG